MSNFNKKSVIVQLDADWTPYTDALPQGSIPLGVVTTLNGITGALILIESTGEYLLIHPEHIYQLNKRKVKAAIHQAQTPIEPDDPEPSIPPPDRA